MCIRPGFISQNNNNNNKTLFILFNFVVLRVARIAGDSWGFSVTIDYV
jgi:hypothetical protein